MFKCIFLCSNDGVQLWNFQSEAWLKPVVFILSFVSFLFLYPSTFNLLEIAAVETPKLHLWGTGIARITRHPQAIGQFLWSLAHTLYIGSSFTLVTSLMLCGEFRFYLNNIFFLSMSANYYSCYCIGFKLLTFLLFSFLTQHTTCLPFGTETVGYWPNSATNSNSFKRKPASSPLQRFCPVSNVCRTNFGKKKCGDCPM